MITKKLEIGKYVFIPQTYKCEEIGDFKAIIQSGEMIKVKRIPYYDENRINYIINGEWSSSNGTNVGCRKYKKFEKNPKYVVEVIENNTKLSFSLYSDDDISKGMRLTIFEYDDSSNKSLESIVSKSSSLFEFPEQFYLSDTRVIYSDNEIELINGKKYIILPSTYDPIESKYELRIMSNKKLKFINCNVNMIKKEKLSFGEINQNIKISRNIIYPSNIKDVPQSTFTHRNPDKICNYEEIKLLYNEIDILNNKLNNHNNISNSGDANRINSPLNKSQNDSKIASLELKIEELKNENKNEIYKYKYEIEKLKDENTQLNDKITELNNKNQFERRKSSLSSLSPIKVKPDKEIVVLEETIKLLNSELNEMKKKYNDLKSEIDNSKTEKERLNNTIILLRSQILSLESDKESKENYIKEIKRLEDNNNKLKTNINELQTVLNEVLNSNIKDVNPPPPPIPSPSHHSPLAPLSNHSPLSQQQPKQQPPPQQEPPPQPKNNDNKHSTNIPELNSTPIVGTNHKNAKRILPPSKLRNDTTNPTAAANPTDGTNAKNRSVSRLKEESKVPKGRSASELKKNIPSIPSLDNKPSIPKPSNLRKGAVNNIKKENNRVVSNSPIQTRIKKN